MSRMRRKRRLLLAGSGSWQPLLFALAGLQVHHPYPSASSVVSTVIVLDHRSPRLERTHRKRDSFKVVARVVEHFIRVPVVRENRVTRVYTHHGVVAVKGRFRPHLAGRPPLFAFTSDIAFLRFRSHRRG